MKNLTACRPVVVGVDGSEAAIGAVRWAAREAVHRDAPLRIVYVVAGACPSESTALDGMAQQYAEHCLRQASHAARVARPQTEIDTSVLYGSVGTTLVLESCGASLICIGSSGIGRVAATVHASIATTLAEHAACPVAVIRYDPERPSPDSGFVVAVLDGCSEDDTSLGSALEEARMRRAPLLALGTFPWPLFDIDDERFHDRLAGWLRRYPDVSVELATTRLSATRYLESFVGAIQLVVVGPQQLDSLTRLVGPPGFAILPHANCSVLITRNCVDDSHINQMQQLAQERSA